MYENYLSHYGIIGMKWGQRRLARGIDRAKARGDYNKATKLKKRLEEEKSIEKMSTSDKLLLSREGVLANQRLIAKGLGKAHRLIKLHGIAAATEFTSEYLANRLQPKNTLDIDMKTGIISGSKTGAIMSMGIETIRMVVSARARARDYMYTKVGQD